MNHSLGAFVVGAGHVLVWLCGAVGPGVFAFGLADRRTMLLGLSGFAIMAGAVPLLLLATTGLAIVMPARASGRVAGMMEATVIEARARASPAVGWRRDPA